MYLSFSNFFVLILFVKFSFKSIKILWQRLLWILKLGLYDIWAKVCRRKWSKPQVAEMIKNLLAVQETCIWSLGGEDPLEKRMAAHSNNPAWKIPWTDDPGGLQSMGLQRVGHDWATNTFTWIPAYRTVWTIWLIPRLSLLTYNQSCCQNSPNRY